MQPSELSTNPPLKLDTSLESNTVGFDSHEPPDQSLINACVHCGFCLTTCPSYRVIGKENDSPRGRIYLMDAINQGEVPLTDAAVSHFESCLGCLACTTACPSGVQYDRLIDSVRSQVNRNHQRPLPVQLLRRLIFSLFPYPDRIRLLLSPLALYQGLGLSKLVRSTGLLDRWAPQLAAMESILPTVTPKCFQDNLPETVPAEGTQRYRVGMILGCVQRVFFANVNEATARVLSANGCEVVIPKSQGCCSALPAHQGETEQAQALARQMIDSFADTGVDYIVINAAGCGHTLKDYGHSLQDDPEYREKAIAFSQKVRDIQEFLVEVGLTSKLSAITQQPLKLVYQDACHLRHGQGITEAPRQLLRQIPGVTVTDPIDAELCCGSAGVYNMLQPDVANELGQMKVTNLVNTGAALIASSNPGCGLQIQKHLSHQGHTMPLMHPIELLDRSILGEQLG
ncbi:MAG: heterodisulfide reductase-related iron-sulfur binding cluster [Cyanobacteria bacterium P01_C01_bin.118]